MTGAVSDMNTERVGRAIHDAVLRFKVQRWLDGSRLSADRPTLAELQEAGYVVLRRATMSDRPSRD